MPWEPTRVRAPHLKPGVWLNSAPRTMEELVQAGIVLVDFWDFTCVNCLRTLPYLIEWHERYAPLGLTILGIHTPEFRFAREPETVAAAVARLGIPYPVLLDSEQANWSAFATRAWPTKYLVDRTRVIRYRRQGEGGYGETEAAIQALLREWRDDDLALPPLMAPLRPTDVPGVVCYPATPELHAGRNPAGLTRAQPGVEREEGTLYFEGAWRAEAEFTEAVGASGVVRVPYRAAELNAVLSTTDGAPRRVYLEQDGQPLSLDEAGEDVVIDSELGSYVQVSAPRLYNMIINPDFARHELALTSVEPGLRLFSFSFVSCPQR